MPQTRARACRRQRSCSRVRNELAREARAAVRGTAFIRAHRALFAESRRPAGHGCQRPSSGPGSGPTGNCLPEMPDCDQPRRAFPLVPCSIELVTSGLHVQEQRVRTCQMCPAQIQIVGKKGESFVINSSTTFPRLSRVSELRNSEHPANLHAFFRLRSAEVCAERALSGISRNIDC